MKETWGEFQEYLGLQEFTDSKVVIKKGMLSIQIIDSAMQILPKGRPPAKDWFALVAKPEPWSLANPLEGLDCKTGGVLPVEVCLTPGTDSGSCALVMGPSEILRRANYVLFFYSGTTESAFQSSIERLLADHPRDNGAPIPIQQGRRIEDRFGNHILASDEVEGKAMLLYPAAFVPGGVGAIRQAWAGTLAEL